MEKPRMSSYQTSHSSSGACLSPKSNYNGAWCLSDAVPDPTPSV